MKDFPLKGQKRMENRLKGRKRKEITTSIIAKISEIEDTSKTKVKYNKKKRLLY
jgi:hypothetical protein